MNPGPSSSFMDIQLPAMSGLEITRILKEEQELRPIPVIAVTAFAMKGDKERILEAGCDDYMSKPISPATFMDTVRGLLDGSQPAAPRPAGARSPVASSPG